MLSRNLEKIVNDAFKDAKSRRHEYMSVEHLLLALLKDGSVANVLTKVGCDVDAARDSLTTHINEHVVILPEFSEKETQPTLPFQRVLQRAVFHIQSTGRGEVSTLNVLIALFSEEQSGAVKILNEQGVSRSDVVEHARPELNEQASDPGPRLGIEDRLSSLEQKVDQLMAMVDRLSEHLIPDDSDSPE